MTLVDAGPLIALIDAADRDHEACVAALDELQLPLVTTWPALTEAMHLAAARGGWNAQEALWDILLRDQLEVLDLDRAAVKRTRWLMAKYRDTPMDLADASLVALAESLNERRVFTLNRHFKIYRLHGRVGFELIP